MEMFCGKIIKVAESERKIRYMERYRSGHNEAVLKTVCPQGRVGSNPTLSVQTAVCHHVVVSMSVFFGFLKCFMSERGRK